MKKLMTILLTFSALNAFAIDNCKQFEGTFECTSMRSQKKQIHQIEFVQIDSSSTVVKRTVDGDVSTYVFDGNDSDLQIARCSKQSELIIESDIDYTVGYYSLIAERLDFSLIDNHELYQSSCVKL